MRLLIYGMQSSGASAIAFTAAQRPESVAFVDVWSQYAAPRLETDRDVVAKVVVTTAYPLERHRERFQPDKTILVLRHPVDVYHSLANKSYAHDDGIIEEKFSLIEGVFKSQNGLFDNIVYYEDFAFAPESLIHTLNQIGWEIGLDALLLKRTTADIEATNSEACPELAEGRLKYGFGNFKGPSLRSDRITLAPAAGPAAFLARACPSLLQHYARLAGKRGEAWPLRDPHEIRATLQQQLATVAAELAAQTEQAAYTKGAIAEYAGLTRSTEDAQRWLFEIFTALDPELIGARVAPVSGAWPSEFPDDVALHRTTVARLMEALDRSNRLALAFHEDAGRWRVERADLIRQLGETQQEVTAAAERISALEAEHGKAQQALAASIAERRSMRRAFERAVGESCRWKSRALALAEMAAADPMCSAPAAASAELPAPLVSIILPVYNQADLVDEAIAGVLSQTYRNWELIVLDDGSDDDLEHRVRQYRDERRLLFLRHPHQRLPAALNHAFAYARGELLTWTSADNIMLPAQLERLVEELTSHPDVGVVYSDYWTIDDKGDPFDDPGWRAHNRDPEIPGLIRLPAEPTIENYHRSGDNFVGASFMYRRAIAAIVGHYADDAFGSEDYDFWLRMHLVTRFRHVAEPLYQYRVHANTLSARAHELGLFANYREFLEADRWRTDTLLTDGTLHRGDGLLRPVDQFHPALLKRCNPVAYSRLDQQSPAARPAESAIADPVIIDIDVPARAVDAAVLHRADILLCRSALTASWLRGEAWARAKRVLTWDGEPTPALQHAFIQTFAEQVTRPITPPLHRAPARIDDAFRPARILLLVERWLSGGLENIVIDLAQSLAADGRNVFVASAKDAPPPAAMFTGTAVATLSFAGDAGAFEGFLIREAIEIVNYHHCWFAPELARRHGAATVYTMHNSYLWMDESDRHRVAAALAEMDRVIAVSRQVAQFGAAQFGIPGNRIAVIANGLRDEIIAAATPRADKTAPFTVAVVASSSPLKLQHVAIAAFAEAVQDIPQFRLRLIGPPFDRAYHEKLQAQIAASPQGHRIELISGWNRAETVAALAQAQLFLLPSLLEGCSIALLEAVAAGCVCIASDVGSARDLHVPGGSLVLLPSPLGELDRVTQRQFHDATASDLPAHRARIAEALREAWQNYPALAARVPEMQARLRELHGMARMTEAYLDTYTMARRGGAPAPRETEAQAALAAAAAGPSPQR